MKQIQNKWTDQETSLLKSNYGRMTYSELHAMLPRRTVFQIRNKASYEGLTQHSNLGRKYSCNKEYFRVPNLENCYWAGFLAADGCVSGNKISFSLCNKDSYALSEFIDAIDYTGKIYDKGESKSVQVSCPEMIRDLQRNFNITPRKSKTLLPPNITDHKLIASFIKGVIDGDGSVHIYSKRITVYGTMALLSWIKQHFDLWTGDTSYRKSNVRRIQEHLCSYRIATSRFDIIFNKLKSLPTFHLTRK